MAALKPSVAMVRLYIVGSVIATVAVLWIAHETGVLIIPLLAKVFAKLAIVKSLVFRRGLTRFGMAMAVPLIPGSWRRRLKHWRRHGIATLTRRRHRLIAWWRPLPAWRKVLYLGPVVVAVITSLVLSLGISGLTFLPVFGFRGLLRWVTGSWLGRTVGGYLAKTAGKLGIDKVAAFVLGGLPAAWRALMRRHSRGMVRSVIRSRRRAHAVVRRKATAPVAAAPPVPPPSDQPRAA